MLSELTDHAYPESCFTSGSSTSTTTDNWSPLSKTLGWSFLVYAYMPSTFHIPHLQSCRSNVIGTRVYGEIVTLVHGTSGVAQFSRPFDDTFEAALPKFKSLYETSSFNSFVCLSDKCSLPILRDPSAQLSTTEVQSVAPPSKTSVGWLIRFGEVIDSRSS